MKKSYSKSQDRVLALISDLDLKSYTDSLIELYGRKKPLYIEGDQNRHFRFIKELDRYEFKSPPKIEDTSTMLLHLSKLGTLKLYEIFEILQIVRYFFYLKKFPFEGAIKEWTEQVHIPDYLNELEEFFDKKGNFNEEKDERLLALNSALSRNKDEISANLRRSISSKKLENYLIDRQIHYLHDQEALLLRGGFNHVLKGNIIGRSSSGYFYVVPQNISSLKAQSRDILQKKESIFYEYADSISNSLGKELGFLKYINREFDRFDHYQARIFFARSKNASFMETQKNDAIILKDFFHPAIANAKPISVNFSKKILMVTGVNAGGKTMLLKSILASAFMAKYLIPMRINAQYSAIGSFKGIEAIIDDPQDASNDISTFAGRMVAFSSILKERNRLIGVDEVELGTDSDEAAALFKVLLEELMKKGSKTVITTHHKRLASLMAFHEEVELMAALYDEKNRLPTYNFLQGIIGKSYAFETALRYGVGAELVKKSREVYGENQERLNDIIERSSELELELTTKKREVDQKLQEITALQVELRDARDAQYHGLKEKKNELHSAYSGAISEAKRAIKAKDIPDAHRSMTNANKMLPKMKKEQSKTLKKIKKGDLVRYRKSDAIVLSIKANEATVEADGMRLRVNIQELKPALKLKKPQPKVSIKKPKKDSIQIKLDLHGMRSEEAVEKLDSFISDALITGIDELWIYHGIGTGKLAYAVKEFLKQHPSVVRFEDAPAHMGGFGAKIVQL